MRKILKKIAISLVLVWGVLMPIVPVVASTPVMADCVETNLFGGCVETGNDGEGIMMLLKLVVKILLYGIGIAAVIGVVVAGILYLTARDNEAQAAKARTRLLEVVIGLLAWAMLFTLLQWLIPGFTGSEF